MIRCNKKHLKTGNTGATEHQESIHIFQEFKNQTNKRDTVLGSLLVAQLLFGDVISSRYCKNLSLAWKKPLVWREHDTVFRPLRNRYSGTWWMSGVSWFTENRRNGISGQGIVGNRARNMPSSCHKLKNHTKKNKK